MKELMQHFHFLRPGFLLVILPLMFVFWGVWRQKRSLNAWAEVCDAHLLPYLVPAKGGGARRTGLLLLFAAAFWMVVAMAGPSWQRLPVPSYRQNVARVVILDMSEAMLEQDLKPDRLSRAKFKLHDLLSRKGDNQFALVVFTGQPFVVSPLTEDSKTIDALLEMIKPDIMPVEGQRLDSALDEAANLLKQGGFTKGQLLVLTAGLPDTASLNTAKSLAMKGINTSILPLVADKSLLPLFEPLARAGKGLVLPFSDKETDLDDWMRATENAQEEIYETDYNVPIWRDEGRWFLLPALVILLPVFRRLWLTRV